MSMTDITLHHYSAGIDTAWYWQDSTGRVISPYMNDSDIAERWGKLYLEAVAQGTVRLNGVTYSAKK
jgi:hypothetical protein